MMTLIQRLSCVLAALLFVACGSEAAEPASPTAEATSAAEAPAETLEAPAEAAAAESLAMGGSAPMSSTEMRNVDGEMHSIASVAQEKGTLVLFTCNHCPYAVAWQDRYVALAHEFMEQGIGVIAINSNDDAEYPSDSFEGTVARAAELSMRFPYVMDETSDVARAFGAEKTPEAYLFDAEGHLVYHGAIDDSQDPEAIQEHYLRDALTAVTAGSAVAQAETLAVGCSIKFREG
jgi:peroxiredoxin